MAMCALAFGKQKVGTALQNPVLLTESRVTVIDGVLAALVLVGLALNAVFGPWWADRVAGLVRMTASFWV